MTAFLLSVAVIFVAELGDKSQLMALTFATRYPWVPVLIGITAATALVHAVSVLIGAVLGATIPTRGLTILAAVAFVAFGLWTLRGDKLTDTDLERAEQPTAHVALAVGGVFFLAELGDKTMFATITLATREGLFGTWLGLDGGHGRGRCAGDRPRARPGHPIAGAGGQDRRRGGLLRVRGRAPYRGLLRLVLWEGTEVELDPQPGGVYRVLVAGQFQSVGEFIEVVPNEKGRVLVRLGRARQSHQARLDDRDLYVASPKATRPACGCATAVCPTTP